VRAWAFHHLPRHADADMLPWARASSRRAGQQSPHDFTRTSIHHLRVVHFRSPLMSEATYPVMMRSLSLLQRQKVLASTAHTGNTSCTLKEIRWPGSPDPNTG